MKKQLLLLTLIISGTSYSQIPEVSFTDFGFQKKVASSETMYYSFEDKFVLDEKKETYIFNENGQVQNSKTTFFDNNISLEKKYTYKNGLLDNFIENKIGNKSTENLKVSIAYDVKNRPDVIVYNSSNVKSIYNLSYNKAGAIEQVFGKFSADYQYQKFYYHKNKLFKKHLDFYKNDKVNVIEEELFINDTLIASFNSIENEIKLYSYTENSKEVYLLPIKNFEKTANEFLNLGDLVKEKNWTLTDYRNVVTSIKDAKLIDKELYLKNEYKDIIVTGIVDIDTKNLNYLYFTKINYADGTTSGDTEFSIFKVNELKAILK